MKIHPSLVAASALLLVAGCAASSSNVKSGGKRSVTFKSSGAPVVGTKIQRTENSSLQMTMSMESNGMHASVPMLLTERSVVDLETLSASKTRLVFHKRVSSEQMGDDDAVEEAGAVHGKTYVVEDGAVTGADGRRIEGEEAQTVVDEIAADDQSFPGEISFDVDTDLPMMNDLVTRQFAAGAEGAFDAESVSVRLTKETAETGVFQIAMRGTLNTGSGAMKLDLKGELELTRNGMRMRHMSVGGPIHMKVPVQGENGPMEVLATGTMEYEMAERSID